MSWPPNSSDINPIEYIWDVMGRQLRVQRPPIRNISDLCNHCLNIWYNLSPAIYQGLVASMPRRVEAVLYAKVKTSVLNQASSMDLDAALRELSLLSKLKCVDQDVEHFNSRELQKAKAEISSSPAPICVVQMNSKFVTNFSLSKNSSSDCNSNEEDGESSIGYLPRSFYRNGIKLYKGVSRLSRFERHVAHRVKPYDILLKKPLRIEPTVKDIPAATAADKDSPPTVSRQDSGNKSNPNSPVKSQSYPVSSGCSIVRSRSLDDLEISKLDFKDDCCSGRYDIDTVSQRISKLHVS
ncbi:uncharacterized protein TNCV_3229551 [Trichonephila clavipes]|nr:uncharacterized protein TNCV_3229551 [Trichonephila clavipes]